MQHKTARMALAGCLTIFLAIGSLSFAASSQQKIAAFKFSSTLSEADQKYLGLEQPGAFTLQDIKAPYVLIEIMRTTCPHCVAQVPALNQLYKLVANSDLKDRLIIFSVVESDDASALKKFKVAHKIPYPLLADPDWEFCSACTVGGTPATMLVAKSGKVLLVEEGASDSAGAMFKKIKAQL